MMQASPTCDVLCCSYTSHRMLIVIRCTEFGCFRFFVLREIQHGLHKEYNCSLQSSKTERNTAISRLRLSPNSVRMQERALQHMKSKIRHDENQVQSQRINIVEHNHQNLS